MENKREPARRCAACMSIKPKRELIRIVYNKEGQLKIDGSGKEAGRGVYVCREQACILSLKKKRGINRSLRREIPGEASEELFARLLAHVE